MCRFLLEGRPRGFSVLFVPEFLGEAAADARLLLRVAGACPLLCGAASLHGLPVGGLLRQLVRELRGEADEWQAVVARSCLRILLAESGGLAERFFAEVERQHRRLYSVGDYLSLLAAPEKALAKAVRQAVGLTPKQYIDRRRLLEAKCLLAYSRLSVKEVGFALGFEEPTNFAKFFRKHCAQSPNAFREGQRKPPVGDSPSKARKG